MSQQAVASIVDAFTAPPNHFPSISLVSHYKGTTLNQQGRIIAIDPDSVVIQATDRLTFPFLCGQVHMRSGAFLGAISATIQPVDYSHGTFQLTKLSQCEWQERKVDRVQPKCPTYIDLQHGRNSFRAFLDDISTDGMGLLVKKNAQVNRQLQEGEDVHLDFQLTPEYIFLYLKGVIMYRRKVGQQLIKVGLTLFPDAYQQKALREYVARRCDQIQQELEQDYIRMREPCRVENLYF